MVWGVWVTPVGHPGLRWATHRYFLHPDSIRSFRTAIPACKKPCKKFLTEISYISLKNSYIVSTILTSGFVLDLGAQEEFDDNF